MHNNTERELDWWDESFEHLCVEHKDDKAKRKGWNEDVDNNEWEVCDD